MKKCYDKELNRLEFTTKNGITFNLNIRGRKIKIVGDSGVGKTLMVNTLIGYMLDENYYKLYDTSNIIIINKDNRHKIGTITNKLIIIDRAEFILNSSLVEKINSDFNGNVYIIIGRKPMGLDISPNYIATMVFNDKEKSFELSYKFSMAGWF